MHERLEYAKDDRVVFKQDAPFGNSGQVWVVEEAHCESCYHNSTEWRLDLVAEGRDPCAFGARQRRVWQGRVEPAPVPVSVSEDVAFEDALSKFGVPYVSR